MVQHPEYPIEFKPGLASIDWDQTYDLIFTQHLPQGFFRLWRYARMPCFELLLVDRFAPLDGAWANDWSTQFYLFLTTFNFCPFNEIPDPNQGNPLLWKSNELDNPQPSDYPPLPPLSFNDRYRYDQSYFVTIPAGKTRLSFLNYEEDAEGFINLRNYNPVGRRVINRVQIDFNFASERLIDLSEYLFDQNREDSDDRGFVACSLVFERFEEGLNPSWVVYVPEGINDDFFLYSDIGSYFNYVRSQIVNYIDDNSSEALRLSPNPEIAYSSSNCLPLGHYIQRQSINFELDPRPINFSDISSDPQVITLQPFPSHYKNHHGLIYANNNRWGNGEIKSDFGVEPVPTEEGIIYHLGLYIANYVEAVGQKDDTKRASGSGFMEHLSGSHDCDPNRSYDFGWRLADYSNYSEYQERILDDLLEFGEPNWGADIRAVWCDSQSTFYRYPLFISSDDLNITIETHEDERLDYFQVLSTDYCGFNELSRGSFYKESRLRSLVLNDIRDVLEPNTQYEVYRYYVVEFSHGAWHEIPLVNFTQRRTTRLFKRFQGVIEYDQEDYSAFNEVVSIERDMFNPGDLSTSFNNGRISDTDYITFLQTYRTEQEATLVDSLRIKEIHATLNASKWAYAENEIDPSPIPLGDKFDLLCKAMGIAFDRDKNILSIRQRVNIEYEGNDVTIPDGWTRGQFALNVGGEVGGQPGGKDGEQLLGMAYQNRANRWNRNAVCADTQVEVNDPTDALARGDVVLCENIPQFLEAMLDDLDKAFNLQEMGVAIIPNADNDGKYCRAEGLGTLLADVAWTISHLSKNIIQTHMISLKNEAMIQELFKAFGFPVSVGNIPVQLGVQGRSDERTFALPFPAFSPDSPTLLQLQYSLLANIAPILASCVDIDEEAES